MVSRLAVYRSRPPALLKSSCDRPYGGAAQEPVTLVAFDFIPMIDRVYCGLTKARFHGLT